MTTDDPQQAGLVHANGPKPPVAVHVVAHTHWDREWYHSAGRFRQRLAALVDALIDTSIDGSYPFLLDGQLLTVMDYLSVYPDRRNEIPDLLRSGELEAGPWYVLADNLIPSGEAIVRNLQAARRLLDDWQVSPPPVAYCPDSFGHPAALPTIANGFGLHTAIVWRGFGGASHPEGDTVWWTSADGSRLLTWHLPRDGYEFGRALPVDEDAAAARWTRIASELIARTATGVVLLPNGADHHALQPDIDAAVEALATAASNARGNVEFERSSLTAFVHALMRAAENAALPDVAGELRDSYGYTWTLQGTFGTRAADKRTNATLERLLLHDVEPWCALGMLQRRPKEFWALDGRVTHLQLTPLVGHAWDTLLQTHPHDTLCGCSIDDVAFAMRERQRDVRSQAVGLRGDALAIVLGHNVVTARSRAISSKTPAPVVVRNCVARSRGGIARIEVLQTVADVAVGPGSAATSFPDTTPLSVPAFDPQRVQLLGSRRQYVRRESPQHYPDNDLVDVHELLVQVAAVPAIGLSVLDLDRIAETPVPQHPVEIRADGDGWQLTNGLVHVDASMHDVSLRIGTRVIGQLIALETQRDAGDSYTPSLRGEPQQLVVTHVARGISGPLRASIDLDFQHPDAAAALHVRVSLVLHADSPDLQLWVDGENRLNDHRLRLRIATAISSPSVHADAAFGPVKREPITVPAGVISAETPPPTMPLHRWVSASNGDNGIALISDGLAEGEVGDGFIAVTLLRAIGQLSRNDLPERPGHAGWPAPIPDAQSQGPFSAQFGIVLHDGWGNTAIDQIEHAADDILLPLVGESWRDLEVSEREFGGLALEGSALRLQAFAPAQDLEDDGAVVRIVNLSDKRADGILRLPYEGLRYCEARLDETPISEWRDAPREIPVSLTPRGVLTLRLHARL